MAREVINNGTVAGDGTGENLHDAFEKTNNNFTELYGEKGFGLYVDSLTTPSVTVTTAWTQITIDALGANVLENLPLEIRGSGQLWAGNKITPISSGDDYDGVFYMEVLSKSGSPTYMEVIIDYANATPDTVRAFTVHAQGVKDAPFKESLVIDFFVNDTFLANGGILYARVDNGSYVIGERNLKISRKSKNLG